MQSFYTWHTCRKVALPRTNTKNKRNQNVIVSWCHLRIKIHYCRGSIHGSGVKRVPKRKRNLIERQASCKAHISNQGSSEFQLCQPYRTWQLIGLNLSHFVQVQEVEHLNNYLVVLLVHSQKLEVTSFYAPRTHIACIVWFAIRNDVRTCSLLIDTHRICKVIMVMLAMINTLSYLIHQDLAHIMMGLLDYLDLYLVSLFEYHDALGGNYQLGLLTMQVAVASSLSLALETHCQEIITFSIAPWS